MPCEYVKQRDPRIFDVLSPEVAWHWSQHGAIWLSKGPSQSQITEFSRIVGLKLLFRYHELCVLFHSSSPKHKTKGRKNLFEPIPAWNWLHWTKAVCWWSQGSFLPQRKVRIHKKKLAMFQSSRQLLAILQAFHAPLTASASRRPELPVHLFMFSGKENFLGGIWKKQV